MMIARETSEKKLTPRQVQNHEMDLKRRVTDSVCNLLTSRANLFTRLGDPRRNIDDELGYPKTEEITADDYKLLYDREPIATRVVDMMPEETWRVQPTVFEDEAVDNETEFETAWNGLDQALRGGSLYQDNEGNPIWEALERLDKLSGIGAYGVLLIGINDGLELSEPAEFGDQSRELLFLRVFDESLAPITTSESDIKNPRFGLPTMYNLTFSDPRESSQAIASRGTSTTKSVHWTRVVHVADNLGSNEVFGVPRMRPVYNPLVDIRKVRGGSAEMYWKGALMGLSIESQSNKNVELDSSDIKDAIEQFQNGLQRYLALNNVNVKSLAPQVEDPTAQIDVQIDAICIQKGWPKRIFVGSERGELASSQDVRIWNGRILHRQNSHVTPHIIVPVIDRFIRLGLLPEPVGYSVEWPDLSALTIDEKAAVAVKQTDALAKYVQGDVAAIVPPLDYLTRVIGWTTEDATVVLEAAVKQQKEDDESDDQNQGNTDDEEV